MIKYKKTICFDIDGVICNNTWGKYEEAHPDLLAIKKINSLYEDNFKIILFTARYMGRSNENIVDAYKKGFDQTKKQLNKWGVKYHFLYLGKPSFDIVIDDKNINYNKDWINKNFND